MMHVKKFQRAGHRWLVWSIALAITLGSIGGILTLHRWSEASHQAVELLGRLEALAHRLSATEWEAMARRGLTAELKGTQPVIRRELDRTIDELARHIDDGELSTMRQIYRAYTVAIDEEFRLLESQRIAEALRVDEEKVDPTYDQLIEAIGMAQVRYAMASRWTINLVNIGSTVVLLLAALFIGGLFSRYERTLRAEQVLLAAQGALRSSEARFRSLVQNASEVIAVVKPLPPTILFISDSVRRIVGHGPEELTGTAFTELVHADDNGRLQQFLASCAYSSGLTHMVEVRLRRGDGQWSMVEMFGDNRLEDSAVGGIVVNFRDVSERRQIELALAQEGYAIDPESRKLH